MHTNSVVTAAAAAVGVAAAMGLLIPSTVRLTWISVRVETHKEREAWMRRLWKG